jgi:two-component system cell cycle sensor histidine kinase/response regulator CckA
MRVTMTTIFVLEDDPDLLRLYTHALSFRGYTVEFTDSAESAINMIQDGACTPDIAVLDMSMPGLPGSAVVEYIRHQSHYPDLPIIVISCDENFRQTLKTAHVEFIAKPISLTELYSAVARHTI